MSPSKNSAGYESPKKDSVALVTGSSGFVGSRLVEMLLERGTKIVVAFDIMKPNEVLEQRFKEVQAKTGGKIVVLSGADGDLTKDASVEHAFTINKINIVYHIGALVGPFHTPELYNEVNYKGTLRIIQNCQKYNVRKLVYSSSPSTRFTGSNVEGLSEDDMPIPHKFLALYAETKAYGEQAVTKALTDVADTDKNQFLTIAVAPHQVYGPHDNLFLPKILETAGTGRLRIFGKGLNKISVCYVDNYCHGLMCGADALYHKSPALGKYYVITDSNTPVYFWKFINQAIVEMEFVDLYKKFHLPIWLLSIVAYICAFMTMISGKQFKLNPFNLRMLTIHRYFNINNAMKDLRYTPLLSNEDAWKHTIEWFKINWLPKWKKQGTSKLT